MNWQGERLLDHRLAIVVPCYNEEEVLSETASRLKQKMDSLILCGKIAPDSRVLFVDDGSGDKTWSMIQELAAGDGMFAGISLSRNRGHQNALLAGLMTAAGWADMVISMDADLQDDIDAVDQMVDHYLAGSDVVYGVRSSRTSDSFFKRFTAEGYYKLLAAMGCQVVFNHADYRLLSKRALEALAQYGERNMFIRGIIPMLGFKTSTVEYERSQRFAGQSKYPLRKMLKLALDGAMALSLKPLRIITLLGFVLVALTLALFLFSVVRHFMGQTILSWKIITISIWGVGGLNLLAMGIIGEYIGRTYMEAKGRPRYHIGATVGLNNIMAAGQSKPPEDTNEPLF
jgi:glycosyltransferase involved in cell wall biosynthesis